jgi:Cu+-exporting ATPase
MMKATETTLKITGLSCNNCALGLQKQLQKNGIKNASVNFTASEIIFEQQNPEEINLIRKIVTDMGYRVIETEKEQKAKSPLFQRIEFQFYFSLLFTIPLLIGMFINYPLFHNGWFQLALCIPVFIIGLLHFGKSALSSLKAGVPNMDVLILTGSSAAFFYSLYGLLNHMGMDYHFFETSASIITLVLLGNLLEHKAIAKTTTAIDDLIKLQNIQAKKIVSINGFEKVIEIKSTEVKSHDVLLANSGDSIAADGIIIWGEALIDESPVTGESIPVERKIGEKVFGGGIVSGGSIKIEVRATGKESLLGQMIELVKNAANDKPPLQNLADKISAVFVPVVIAISVITFILNYFVFDIEIQPSVLRAIAVLVISCPCALGLAIPTAVVAGIGRVFKKGVLIKGASTLQKLHDIKHFVFDKTGTITSETFSVKKLECFGISHTEAASIISSLEKHSNHAIAKSLTITFADASYNALFDIEEKNGIGMQGKDADGNIFRIGSSRIIPEGTVLSENFDIYLLKNNVAVAGIQLENKIKSEAAEIFQYLRNNKISTYLVSGDKLEKCMQVGEALNISEVMAEKLPDEKLSIISELEKKFPTVMIGDGINDAPALSRASLGISVSNGTQIAMNAAQIILLDGNLKRLKYAIIISNATVKIIKQNLFWAFFYNVIAIPLAAFGYLNPLIAAAAMALSDIIVISNSLRLTVKKVD